MMKKKRNLIFGKSEKGLKIGKKNIKNKMKKWKESEESEEIPMM